MQESVAVKEVSKPGEISRGKQATAGGWSRCQPQAAGLGGKAPGKCFPAHTAVLMPQTEAPSRGGYIMGRKVQMPKLM